MKFEELNDVQKHEEIKQLCSYTHREFHHYGLSVMKQKLSNNEHIEPTSLYVGINSLEEAYILAQYEISKKASDEIIYIFPANNPVIRSTKQFDFNAIAEYLAKQYTLEDD